ncbi:MAG: electron transfer flavoprotein subunit alpha, partial [Proteobacteria bacterium]|nr:electron transfer flavoprotein subunit alpha [Pseudomonadota bacterium]
MKSVLVYIETDNDKIRSVSLELLSKGNELKEKLDTELHAALIGKDNDRFLNELFAYGVDKVFSVEGDRFTPYRTIPHTRGMLEIIKKSNPQIILYGA